MSMANHWERKAPGEKVLEEILSSIALPLLCSKAHADWLTLGRILPSSHSGHGKIGGQYSLSLTLSDQTGSFILKMKLIPLRPLRL